MLCSANEISFTKLTANICQILIQEILTNSFLPRCMECRRGLAMGILSVRLSVRPSSVKRVHCDKTEESCI